MPEPLLRISHLTKKFGDATVVDDLSLEIMPGECLGVIGPERRRQDDDDPHLPRPHRRRRRHDRGVRPAAAGRRCAKAKERIGVVTQFDSLDPDFTCAENLRVYGALLRPAARDDRRARAQAARVRGAAVEGRRQARRAVGRHEAAPLARPRPRQRPRPAPPRRADHRPRPAGAPPDVGAAAEPAPAGQGDPAHDPLHGRGRAPVRPPDRPRPRQEDRRRARRGS